MDTPAETKDCDVPDPSTIPLECWKNYVSLWPTISKESIQKYLIETPSIDGSSNNAFLSLEAVDFLVSGWIDTVLLAERNHISLILKARVARSQTTTKVEHEAWVLCERTGQVLTGSCSCMAGLGHVCSHVAAILFKILEANKLGLNKKSCTDVPMIWNASTRRHVIPEKFKNIKIKKHYLDHGSYSVSPTKKFNQYYDHKELETSVANNPFLKLMNMNTTLWNSILQAKEQPQSDLAKEQEKDIQNCHGIHEEVFYHETNHENFRLSCSGCNHFYEKYIFMTVDQTKELCQGTLLQSSDEMWKDSRKIRITASTASSCPKRQETNPDKFLKSHLYKTFKGNVNTEYGKRSESEAITSFENITSLKVVKSGTVVADTDCWLSASPDGLVDHDSILEVKCPMKNIAELLQSGKYDVRLNKQGDPFLHKSGKSGYYLQVQLTMHCTGRQKCFFFVWEKLTPVILLVQYDEDFVKGELKRLRCFYFQRFLPFLCAENFNGKLLFGRKFKKLMNLN